MTVQEFVGLCVEDSLLEVTLYDMTTGENVWSGHGDDVANCEYANYEVMSFDLPEEAAITLNIETDSTT